MIEVVLLPEAEADVDLACAWYESQRPGLSDRFRERLQQTFETIVQTPSIGTTVSGECRRLVMKKFPYCIFYEVIEDVVYIHAVFQASQDPKKWLRRLS